MRKNVLAAITDTGLIAIMRGLDHKHTLKAAEALIRGGVKALEVTYNTPGAVSILKDIAKEFGADVFVGAGTVTTKEDLDSAIEAGASFILAPHFDSAIIKKTVEAGLVAIPGAFTATEVLRAYRAGAGIVKIFPASSVGPQYIKDLKGPLNTIPLMPVGGVDIENAGAFIKAGSAALGVGGSLIKKELISQGHWDKLTALAEAYLQKVQEARR
jgi:2-dehydro-3-deoxyphosphogluconate aldolase/(4S)-4-hydroxy-2-oxoglutarate aldolase